MKKRNVPLLIVVLLPFTISCGLGAKQLDPLSLTLTPLSAAIKGTATAGAADVGGAGDKLATAVAKATSESRKLYVTQTALAVLNDQSRWATATFEAPVVAELPRYGVNPNSGHVGWIHNPVTIDLNGYQQYGFANDYGGVTAKDFVLAADITWYTHNSLSACGFMFRSNGDKVKPDQYMVFITSFASGYLAFTGTTDGEISNMRVYFPKNKDQSFNWFNNGTNRLVIVARGTLIDLYTNAVLIATVDITKPPPDSIPTPPNFSLPAGASSAQMQQYNEQREQYNDQIAMMRSQLAKAKRNFATSQPLLDAGLLSFLGVSQSGQTTCTFSNAWLFVIDE
jgi:hypothetical protein